MRRIGLIHLGKCSGSSLTRTLRKNRRNSTLAKLFWPKRLHVRSVPVDRYHIVALGLVGDPGRTDPVGLGLFEQLRTRDTACITFDTITNSTTTNCCDTWIPRLCTCCGPNTCWTISTISSTPSVPPPTPHMHNDALYALHTPRRKGLAKTQARVEHRGTPTPLYHSCDETQIYAQLLRVASNLNDHERQSKLQALRTQCPISSSTLPCPPNNRLKLSESEQGQLHDTYFQRWGEEHGKGYGGDT